MKDILFLGSKEVGSACLGELLNRKDELDIRVVGVLTNDRQLSDNVLSIREICAQHHIPIIPSLDQLSELPQVDLLISVQYHEILRSQHIRQARELAVNLHMAPLPEYRGCNQFSFAIIDGAREFGTTLHRLEEQIDAGAVLFEKRFAVPENCFVKDLYRITFDASIELFRETIGKIVAGDYQPTAQSELMKTRSSSYHRRNEIEGIKRIDPGWETEKQKRHFRATYFPPFDPPYLWNNGEKQPLTPEWYEAIG